jgi:hypothetical protein
VGCKHLLRNKHAATLRHTSWRELDVALCVTRRPLDKHARLRSARHVTRLQLVYHLSAPRPFKLVRHDGMLLLRLLLLLLQRLQRGRDAQCSAGGWWDGEDLV